MSLNKKPIIKVFFVKPKDAWYQLSKKEKHELMRGEKEIAEKLKAKYGYKLIILCDAFWSTENWIAFGVEEYPDIAAVQECTRALREYGFFRYFESRIFFGTPEVPLEVAES